MVSWNCGADFSSESNRLPSRAREGQVRDTVNDTPDEQEAQQMWQTKPWKVAARQAVIFFVVYNLIFFVLLMKTANGISSMLDLAAMTALGIPSSIASHVVSPSFAQRVGSILIKNGSNQTTEFGGYIIISAIMAMVLFFAYRFMREDKKHWGV